MKNKNGPLRVTVVSQPSKDDYVLHLVDDELRIEVWVKKFQARCYSPTWRLMDEDAYLSTSRIYVNQVSAVRGAYMTVFDMR